MTMTERALGVLVLGGLLTAGMLSVLAQAGHLAALLP